MNLIFDLGNQGYQENLNVDSCFEIKTPVLTNKEKALHERALFKARNFKNAYSDLLEIVMEVQQARLFEKFLLTSATAYCREILKLSEDVTSLLTKVASASRKFPELKEAIISDEIHMTNARQISHLLTEENKTEWIEKAKCLSQRKLQKEIAKAFPREAVQENAKYVAEDRIKLQVGLDEETMAMLNWARDFVSQKIRSAASYETTLEEVLTEFKERNDPVLKAERSKMRQEMKKTIATTETKNKNSANANANANAKVKTNSNVRVNPDKPSVALRSAQQNTRTPIPATVIHELNLRDKRKCQLKMPNGKICGATRWVDYHHIVEVQNGGTNTLENLTTLCSGHHRMHHNHKH